MNEQKDGLISGMLLDGQGGYKKLDWNGVNEHWDDDDMVWVHLDYTNETTQDWLRNKSGLDPIVCDVLLSKETRPRSLNLGDGLLVILRGIDINSDSDPEDMVSMRFWIEKNRLITLRQFKHKSVDDVREVLDKGQGPKNAVELMLSIIEKTVYYIGEAVNRIDDNVDNLEEEVLTHETYELRSRIGQARRSTIGIRRFLAPQREAMSRLAMEDVSWIEKRDSAKLREIADQVTRYVEDLDSIRDRAAVTQEELVSRLAEQTNHTIYLLSIIAGIFLPLSFLTGLLGINVAGMPGTENPSAFWVVCGLIVAITIFEIIIFRRKKWL